MGEQAPTPTKLNPIVEQNKDKLLKKTDSIGINVVITGKWRSNKRQSDLFAKGRSADGDIVTYAEAGESYHNYGLAIDYAEVAKQLGFAWGGDWHNFKDYSHLQRDFGLSIRQLKNGLRSDIEDAKNK